MLLKRAVSVLQWRLSVFSSLQQAMVTKQKFSTFTNKEGDRTLLTASRHAGLLQETV